MMMMSGMFSRNILPDGSDLMVILSFLVQRYFGNCQNKNTDGHSHEQPSANHDR
nr:MAG TPA: hypothetical protein [Caudoviricetes sp.]